MKKRNFLKVLAASAILGTFALASCGEVEVQPTSTQTSQIESINISVPDNVSKIKVGQTLQLTADSSVTWSSSDSTKATVSAAGLVTAVAEGNVRITATSTINTSITKSISLIIEKDASNDAGNNNGGNNNGGNVDSDIDWSKVEYSTHAQYLEAVKETPLKVKGVVTHVAQITDKNGVTTYSYYLSNGTNGFYIYGQDLNLGTVEKGKAYEVGGLKKYASGQHELVTVSLFNAINENITYGSASIAGIDVSSEEATTSIHGSIVEGEAVITDISVNETKAYSFSAKIGEYSIDFRIDTGLLGNDFAVLNNKLKGALVGQSFTFKGYMSHFGYGKTHAPQIQIVTAADLTLAVLDANTKLDIVSKELGIVAAVGTNDTKIELPTKIEGHSDVSISWASADSSVINVETGVVTHPGEAKRVKLTATLKIDQTTKTCDFEVYVFAKDTKQYNTVVASLDFEDAAQPTSGSYGVSGTKNGYAAGNVNLGGHTWLLDQALIASDGQTDGTLGGRVKVTNSQLGKIELVDTYLDFDAIDFKSAYYNATSKDAVVYVEYQLEGSNDWIKVEESLNVNAGELADYHYVLPQGNKKVRIVVSTTAKSSTVNIDCIKLVK